ncbi:MAG: hypothetical protein HC853_12120, partial [Anaerolineae bacterium]|nr:hypothetical protein [Anaerolineae bacterium]
MTRQRLHPCRQQTTATRRRPTVTPSPTVLASPTVNATATRSAEIEATATRIAEQNNPPPQSEPTATALPTPEIAPTSAITEFIAAKPSGPILIYTYTQQLKADGNHLVAACVLNIGDAPASDVETAFDAKSPAVITGLRIPSELSSRGATRATVRIATLIESVEVNPDQRARVILNERTGTVIMGESVRVMPIAIAHGTLTVRIKTDFGVSQASRIS